MNRKRQAGTMTGGTQAVSRPVAVRAFVAVLALAAILLAGCATGSAGRSQATAPQLTTPPTTSTSAAQASPKLAPVSRALPKPAPPAVKAVNYCAGNTAPQLVLVSITQQHVWMCADTRTVYQSGVTTGMVGEYTSTPTGQYA
ncbi:MAG: hypothetical protein ABI232_00135, partial [Jatrophihabitantaceae bacterium]